MTVELVEGFRRRGKGYRKGPPPRLLVPPAYQAEHALRVFQGASSAVPASASIEDLVVTVEDQGQEGSCTAFGCGQAVRCCQVRAGVADPFLPSPQDSYAFARLLDGTPLDQDVGSFVHSEVQGYQVYGFARALVPYSDSSDQWSKKPTAEYERAAFDQARRTETSVHEIVGTDDMKWLAVQQALANRCPVIWAGDVSVAFAENAFDPTKPLDPPMPADIDGGHCMMLTGYSDAGARTVNSWSTSWGDKGFFLASRAFVLAASELFVVEHVVLEGQVL